MSDRPDLDKAVEILQAGGWNITGGKYAPTAPQPISQTPHSDTPKQSSISNDTPDTCPECNGANGSHLPYGCSKWVDTKDGLDGILGRPNEMMTSWEIERLVKAKASINQYMLDTFMELIDAALKRPFPTMGLYHDYIKVDELRKAATKKLKP